MGNTNSYEILDPIDTCNKYGHYFVGIRQKCMFCEIRFIKYIRDNIHRY